MLVIPEAGRLLDPTIQQYREIPATSGGQSPIIAPLPAPPGLGEHPFAVIRGDHEVLYVPVPSEQRQAWRHPSIAAVDAEYQRAGLVLASNVFDMMRLEQLRPKLLASPYPRLRQLWEAIGDGKSIADSTGYRFLSPTGAEIRLSDVG
ncbi:hypothetical protein [Microbispora sp. CA-102843]|uniref:hypothetical protein n=1 Tax=Microbispora sp. CA-102843 TaxID=3239952 RepID=UPI003D93990B